MMANGDIVLAALLVVYYSVGGKRKTKGNG
jgi:hypothetical protein